MRKELDKKLCEEFPMLYRDRHGDMRNTAMVWGFSHGDGWFDIVHTLSGVIDNIIQNAKNTAKYNYKRENKLEYDVELSEEVLKELGVTGEDEMRVVAVQVKEKYGGLRFYIQTEGKLPRDYYDQVNGAIEMAEALSYNVCEECGNPGKTRGGGWIRTLCDKCVKKDTAYETTEDTNTKVS